MEIPTETCTQDIKKMLITALFLSFQVFFFRTFRQLRRFRSFRYGRFVLLFFYAKVTVLMVKMKYDRFLQVVAEQETIIWPVLF